MNNLRFKPSASTQCFKHAMLSDERITSKKPKLSATETAKTKAEAHCYAVENHSPERRNASQDMETQTAETMDYETELTHFKTLSETQAQTIEELNMQLSVLVHRFLPSNQDVVLSKVLKDTSSQTSISPESENFVRTGDDKLAAQVRSSDIQIASLTTTNLELSAEVSNLSDRNHQLEVALQQSRQDIDVKSNMMAEIVASRDESTRKHIAAAKQASDRISNMNQRNHELTTQLEDQFNKSEKQLVELQQHLSSEIATLQQKLRHSERSRLGSRDPAIGELAKKLETSESRSRMLESRIESENKNHILEIESLSQALEKTQITVKELELELERLRRHECPTCTKCHSQMSQDDQDCYDELLLRNDTLTKANSSLKRRLDAFEQKLATQCQRCPALRMEYDEQKDVLQYSENRVKALENLLRVNSIKFDEFLS
ncbi:hypothetical protein HDE_12497 [Halotydeus destructor]|nr:hypothetical protein HDE_12497 [Halotydeus destructor]